MAREILLAGVPQEELQPAPPPPPQTPKSKWENFWYHYKWAVIAGVCAAVLLAVLLGDALSKDNPDYTLLLVTERDYLPASLQPMQTYLEQYGTDLDGDGKTEVRIITCHLGTVDSGTTTDQYTNFQVLQSHLIAGDVMLFAFEPQYFQWFVKTMDEQEYQFLSPLETDGAGVAEDGLSWNWKDNTKAQEAVKQSFIPQLNVGLPEKLCFGVRVASGTAARRTEEQQQALALLRAVING
mgnify:CR=1 FL=1